MVFLQKTTRDENEDEDEIYQRKERGIDEDNKNNLLNYYDDTTSAKSR